MIKLCLAAAFATHLLTPLFGRIWQATTPSAPGSLYIFLPNGTLLMTSCVETYRISTWTEDPKRRGVMQVVEDGVPTYTLTINKVSGRNLQLKQTLIRSNEKKELTLKAIEKEFVCPDLPK